MGLSQQLRLDDKPALQFCSIILAFLRYLFWICEVHIYGLVQFHATQKPDEKIIKMNDE